MNGNPPGAIWPTQDEASVQIREVYSRFGLAMYHTQVLEHGMVNAVIIARLLPTMMQHPDRTTWEKAFDQAYNSGLAKTFGNMLRELETLSLPDDLVRQLRHARIDRDRLAHRFFREHDEDLLSRSGRTRMIIECEEAIERFATTDAALEAIMRPQRERYGITTERLDDHVSAMVAAAAAKS